MKKITFILFYIIANHSIAQKTNFQIYSKLEKPFQIFIDGQLQSYEAAAFYNVINVPNTTKEISVNVIGHIQKPKISIDHSIKNSIYEVSYNNNSEYEIKKVSQASVSNVYKAIAAFIPKQKPVKLDSNYKFVHSCKEADSNLSKLMNLYGELKHPIAKEKILKDKLKTKCLLVYQLKKMSYSMNSDQDRYNFFMNQYESCLDRNLYYELMESLANKDFQTKFELWMKGKNII